MSEHHNPFIDKLAELVGQERANQAIALADKAREHTASLIRQAAEAVAPGPDQTELLADLEERLQTAEATNNELEAALVRRAAEISLLNDTIVTLKAEALTSKPAAPKRGA